MCSAGWGWCRYRGRERAIESTDVCVCVCVCACVCVCVSASAIIFFYFRSDRILLFSSFCVWSGRAEDSQIRSSGRGQTLFFKFFPSPSPSPSPSLSLPLLLGLTCAQRPRAFPKKGHVSVWRRHARQQCGEQRQRQRRRNEENSQQGGFFVLFLAFFCGGEGAPRAVTQYTRGSM